jgi:hypothetical protein
VARSWRNARNEHNTDPAAFRVFQRRCETLFALICCRGDPELGVAGIDWAQRQLSTIEGPNEEETNAWQVPSMLLLY